MSEKPRSAWLERLRDRRAERRQRRAWRRERRRGSLGGDIASIQTHSLHNQQRNDAGGPGGP
jgi:hypothetical protein